MTVNRFCSSGLQAIAFAAERIMCGLATVIVAGGTESMSLVPMGGNKIAPNPTLMDRYPDVYLSTGLVAENHARESDISREAQDAFALRSHQRAIAAIDERPLRRRDRPGHGGLVDAGAGSRPRAETRSRSTKDHGAIRPLRRWQASAGVSRARHGDGRQFVADERRRGGGGRDVRGARARARPDAARPLRGVRHGGRRAGALRHRTGAGDSESAEARRALTLDQIDLVELNEAFASQVLACLKELPIDPDRLNVNGGAIALGHPLGCTGAKLTTTLLYEMKRRNARYGLVTMCVGGGMGAAGIFERCSPTPASTDVDPPRRRVAAVGRLRPVFTPERLTEEHRLIRPDGEDFVDKEVLPCLDRLEQKDWDSGAPARAALRRARPPRRGRRRSVRRRQLDKVTSMIVSEQDVAAASFGATFGAQVNLVIPAVALRHRRAEAEIPAEAAAGEIGAYCAQRGRLGIRRARRQTRATRSPTAASC